MRRAFIIIYGIITFLLMFYSVSAQTISMADDTFTELKINDPSGKAVFTLDNDIKDYDISRFSLSFNEVCGKVNSWSIKIKDTCEIFHNDSYWTYRDECTYEKNESCISVPDKYISDEWSEYIDCWKHTDIIPQGIDDYYIDADISPAICSDGHMGYQIDWIPQLQTDTVMLKQERWAWWNSSFPYCRNISILGAAGSLTNFPHYANIDNTTDINPTGVGFKILNHSCFEGTAWKELDFEVENITTNNLDLWIKENATTAQLNLSIYYNTTDTTDYSDDYNTWSEYIAVYHFNDGTGNNVRDSRANHNGSIVAAAISWITGSVVDGAANIRGNAGDILNLNNDADFSCNDGDGCSMEIWGKFDQVNNRDCMFAKGACFRSSANFDFGVGRFTDDKIYWQVRDGAGAVISLPTVSTVSTTDSFHYFAATWDGTTNANKAIIYYNGTSDNTATAARTTSQDTRNMHIAGDDDPGVAYEHDGDVDEARFYDGELPADWIAYNHQLITNQTGYVTIGDVQIEVQPIEYHSMQSTNLEFDDISFASDDKIELYKIEYNATFAENIFVWSLNTVKESGGGTNIIECDFMIDGVNRRRESIATVSTTGSIISTGSIINISTSVGLHNLSVNCSRTGSGTITLSDIDAVIGIPRDEDGDAVRLNYIEDTFTHSSTSFLNSYTIDINKTVQSPVYYMSRLSTQKTPAGDVDYYYRNNESGISSPYWTRYLSSPSSQGNMLGLFINTENISSHNQTIMARVNSGTATVNLTYIDFDLADVNNHIVNHNFSSDIGTNISTTKTYTAGLSRISESNITIRDGEGVYISAQSSFGTSTGSHTPALYINSTDGSVEECEYRKSRALSGNSDRANVFIFGNCFNLTIGNTYSFGLYVNVSAGENVIVYDEALSIIETNNISAIPQDTPPLFIDNIPDFSVTENTTIYHAGNFSSGSAVSFGTNCTFLNVSVNNATTEYNLTWNATTVGVFYCIGWLYEPVTGFNTTSDEFSITVNAYVPPPPVVPDEYDILACDYGTGHSLFLVMFSLIVIIVNLFIWRCKNNLGGVIVGIGTIFFSLYVWACALFIGLVFVIIGVMSILMVFT